MTRSARTCEERSRGLPEAQSSEGQLRMTRFAIDPLFHKAWVQGAAVADAHRRCPRSNSLLEQYIAGRPLCFQTRRESPPRFARTPADSSSGCSTRNLPPPLSELFQFLP